MITTERATFSNYEDHATEIFDYIDSNRGIVKRVRPDTELRHKTLEDSVLAVSKIIVSDLFDLDIIRNNSRIVGLATPVRWQELRHPQERRVIRGRLIDMWAIGLSEEEQAAAATAAMHAEGYVGPVIAALTHREQELANGIGQVMERVGEPTNPKKPLFGHDPFNITKIPDLIQLYEGMAVLLK